jgi:hypothetical protein
MAKYLLLQDAFIDNHFRKEGAAVVVADTMIPGPHMRPVDNVAKAMCKKHGVINDVVPDYVDHMTSLIDVTKFGASPQNMDAGVAFNAGVNDALGPELLQEIPGQNF